MSKKTKTIDKLLTEVVQFNDSIPSNWLVVTADTIIDVRDGTHDTPKYVEEGFPLITSKNLKNGKLDFSNVKYISPEDHELICKRSRVDEQDILFAMIGTIGNPVLVEDIQNEFSIKNVGLFKPNRKIVDSKYLYYYLSSPIYLEPLIGNAKGSTQKFVSLGVLRKSPIILPPINEQKRIAEKIERLFARIDEAKRLIEEVKESIELRRTAILDKAFKGQLGTNDPNEKSMLETSNNINEKDLIPREEQPYEVPENWVWTRLGNLVHFIGGGTPSKTVKKYWDGNIPWATVKDIKGKYLLQTKDSITEEGLNNSSASLAAEEELIVVTRMSPGKAIISKIKTAINQDLKIVKPKTKIHSGFLWIFFEVNRPLIESLSTGSTVKGIQIKKLDELLISLPPYEEQKRIAEKVDNLLSNLENEQELVLEVEEKLNLLKQSILNKAFRGELGTNDPNDEHAIELLKEVLKSKSK